VGRSVREGEPIWCQDFLHDPTTQTWHARAAQYRWSAVASLPLRCEGEVVGALALYAAFPQAFSPEIQTLLVDMVVDVDLALDHFARQAKSQAVQNALQRSEREYRELTETIHDVIWRIDAASLTYLYVSPAVYRLLGITAEQLVGKPLINAQSDENRRWISNLRELYSQSQLSSGLDQEAAPYRLDELQHLHRNGSVVWSEVTTTLVRSSSSGAMEFHCVSRDITARKQAESQLEWLAYYDKLTELPNRTLVHNLLEQVIRTAHRDANLSRCQSGRVVNAIAHHRNNIAVSRQTTEFNDFLVRHQTGADVVGSELCSDVSSHSFVVTGQNHGLTNSHLLQRPHRLRCFWTHLICNSNHTHQPGDIGRDQQCRLPRLAHTASLLNQF
jgi:PAS domain S-box-containing protein